MPCYTTTTINVDARKLNLERLRNVIAVEGFNASVINGQLEVYGRTVEDATQNRQKIMQEYAAQTIKDAAKRFGWQVKNQSTENKLIKIQLRR